MSRRAYLVPAILGCSLAIPVIIGASCPPPTTPYFPTIDPQFTSVRELPDCVAGFVCISIVNQACIPAEVALYTHDGFDLDNEYTDPPSFECCTGPNPATPCPCPRVGALIGELELIRPELFGDTADEGDEGDGGDGGDGDGTAGPPPTTLTSIQGNDTRTLLPNESLLIRIQCEDVKTMGVAVGMIDGALTEPAHRELRHREPLDGSRPGQDEVPCGGTVEFIVYDLSQCANPALTDFAMRVEMSN